MTTIDLDQRLRTWMSAEGSGREPDELYDRIVGSLARVDQRPRLLVSSAGGLAVPVSDRRLTAGRLGLAALLVALLVAAVAAAILVGAQLLQRADPDSHGIFIRTGAMPIEQERSRPAIALLDDGRVLVAGGNPSEVPPSAVIYDPVSGTYGAQLNMQSSRERATATTLSDGTVLIAGGLNAEDVALSTAELFDPTTSAFRTVGSMAAARADQTATRLADGRVLIAGGIQTQPDAGGNVLERPLSSAEIFDPRTGEFKPVGSMTTSRARHTAALLPDGSVLITGGISDAGAPTATAEVFDPGSSTFRPVEAMSIGRASHSATVLQDGRVLIVGGQPDGTGQGQPDLALASAELFDPRTGRFEPTGSLRTERFAHSATLMADGRVLIAGGVNAFGAPRTAELFDPPSGTFHAAGAAGADHIYGVAPRLPDGRVLLVAEGGESELYDPTRLAADEATPSSSAEAPSAPAARPQAVETSVLRSEHTATLLPDGRVLIAGGIGGPNEVELASAELFDPSTGRVTSTGSMSRPRSSHVAEMMADGRVVIVGEDANGLEAEVYDPTRGTFGPPTPELARLLSSIGRVRPVGLGDGRVLLFGSSPATATTAPRETVAVLDPSSAIVSPAATACRTQSQQIPVSLADGRVLVTCDDVTPAEIYDPASGAMRDAGFTGDFRAAVRLDDGRVLLARPGPDDPAGLTATTYLEPTAIYDPATDRLESFRANGPDPARGGVMVSLGSRVVLLAGGDGTPLPLTALLNPNDGTVRTLGPLLAPRERPTATRLADGRVLIVGGAVESADRTDPIPAGAELLDPDRVP
jgi:hypothetical protein